MEWAWKQEDLGALGFAGICRETYRVLLRVILPNTKGGPGAAIPIAVLLAHATAMHAFAYWLYTDDRSIIVRFLANILGTFFQAIFLTVFLLLAFMCTAAYVFRVASLYCIDGDGDSNSVASKRILRDLLRAPVALLLPKLLHLFPFFILYNLFATLSGSSYARLHLVAMGKGAVYLLPLEVIATSALANIVSYGHIACVVTVHDEGAILFDAMRKSGKLLAGKS
jgi:hypothetical protein